MGLFATCCKLVVDGKIAPRLCDVRGRVKVQVYRNHEPVAAIALSRDGNSSPMHFPKELLGQIVPLQVATLIMVVGMCGASLVVISCSAPPREFERVVEQIFSVYDHAQLGEVGVDYGQYVGLKSRQRCLPQAHVHPPIHCW